MTEDKMISFSVSSSYGHRTRQGYVQVLIEAADFMTQMPPASAREIAMNLLQAAEAAEVDAYLMTYVLEKVGAPLEQAAQMLVDFRDWRAQRASRRDPDVLPGEEAQP